MANGFMVIGSRFKPFSYDEMLKPLAAYTDEYNTQEAAYGELANNASQWAKLKDSNLDKDTYEQYKEYADKVKASSDQLSAEGLKPGGRKAILDSRRQYTESIVPIEQAYLKRGEQSKFEREMLAKDPTTLINRRADQISLKEYIANPELSSPTYSGAYLESSASKAASALSRDMRSDPRKWRSILGGQYYESRMQAGYTAEEIQRALSGDPTAPKELSNVMSQVMQPLAGWDNQEALASAGSHVARGMWNAIGEEKYQMADNWMGKMVANAAMSRGESAPAQEPLFPGGTVTMASPSETIKDTKDKAKSLNKILNKGTLRYPSKQIEGIGFKGTTSIYSDINLFDSEGRLRSKDSFVREGKTEQAKNHLSEVYDNLESKLDYFGVSLRDAFMNGTAITKNNIQEAITNRTIEDSPTKLNFERLPLDPKETKETVGALLQENFSDDGKHFDNNIQEIVGWDKNNNPKFSSSAVKVSDLLNQDKETEAYTLKAIPTINVSHISTLSGQVMTLGNKVYLIKPSGFNGRPGADEVEGSRAEVERITANLKEYPGDPRLIAALEKAKSNLRRTNTSIYTVSAGATKMPVMPNTLFTSK